MFTGLIEDAGTVDRVVGGPSGGKVLTVRTGLDTAGIAIGDSIAVNGVCLTATRLEPGRFTVDAGPETLARTTIGRLGPGQRVNLERALALGARLGGHLVQGHVDGVGAIRAIRRRENAVDLDVGLPAALAELVAERGSIAIDGISLTVTGLGPEHFSVSVIPHTWSVTTLAERRLGDPVNLEADLLARYLQRMLDARGLGGRKGLTEAQLRGMGY
jgi:riboflavin synthase